MHAVAPITVPPHPRRIEEILGDDEAAAVRCPAEGTGLRRSQRWIVGGQLCVEPCRVGEDQARFGTDGSGQPPWMPGRQPEALQSLATGEGNVGVGYLKRSLHHLS